ncbi:MAG: thioredoxin family protein [Planctomycetaceae bacterium]|nr:thioredoxin family protein [Planctomycetaceae bacterium]
MARTRLVKPALFAAAVMGMVLAGAWASSTAPPAQTYEPRLVFGQDFEAAMRQGAAARKPVVLYFGGAACVWCRKMEVSTFTARPVLALSERFVWVKVDPNDRPDLAGVLEVSGVPAIFVIAADGRVVNSCGGYVAPEALTEFLRKSLDKANAPPESSGVELIEAIRTAAAGGEPSPRLQAAVGMAVNRLAQTDRSVRPAMLEGFKAIGRPAWPVLCDLMAESPLAKRAAAAGALAYATGAQLPFDPFADAPQRAAQVAAWRAWIAAHAATRPATATSEAK